MQRPGPPLRTDSAESPDGGAAAREWGAEILATVDLDAIAAQLSRLPTAPLLAELEAIVATIEHANPASSRRRAGWWGRLLGRDLVAQAQPDPVASRIRLRIAAAKRHAAELAAQAAALEPLSVQLQAQADRLERTVADTRARANDAGASGQQRLSHLDAIAASWRSTVAQIGFVRAHAAQLLDRHAQVRDLLMSLWQEGNAAQAAAAQFSPDRIAALQDALRTLRDSGSSSSTTAAHHDRPTKEPSP